MPEEKIGGSCSTCSFYEHGHIDDGQEKAWFCMHPLNAEIDDDGDTAQPTKEPYDTCPHFKPDKKCKWQIPVKEED